MLDMGRIPVILVQGGAGSYAALFDSPEHSAAKLDAVKKAAKAGYKVLQHRGTAVDAVQAAVAYMEDNPLFNAGSSFCLLGYNYLSFYSVWISKI